jgi:hypothetical protein
MKVKFLTILTLAILCTTPLFGQRPKNNRSVFIQTEYQFLNYNYLTVGLGYQPRKTLLTVTRKNSKYSFIGWTVNYSKKLENSDWGASIQNVLYSGTENGPLGIGIEINYKSINQTDHFGAKPLIGLSFPLVSIMYAYNFDFYKTESERINQHEIILGLRLAIFRQRK